VNRGISLHRARMASEPAVKRSRRRISGNMTLMSDWHGLLPWFCRQFERNETLRRERPLRDWYTAAKSAARPSRPANVSLVVLLRDDLARFSPRSRSPCA